MYLLTCLLVIYASISYVPDSTQPFHVPGTQSQLPTIYGGKARSLLAVVFVHT